MNKIREHWLFSPLRRTALAVGIVMFLLGIFLFMAIATPECNDASIACFHHSTPIETDQSEFSEQISSEPTSNDPNCEEILGSTGWTGAVCTKVPIVPPTPTRLSE